MDITKSESHDNTMATDEPDSSHDAMSSSSSIHVADSRIEQFTLFPKLPTELRLIIWDFAMQEPRLVHIRAEECVKRYEEYRRYRHGCPRTAAPKFKIYGCQYEQVPTYFFINRECRYLALKHYSIRFSFTPYHLSRWPNKEGERPLVRSKGTNFIMSPDDILVSWYAFERPKVRGERDQIDLKFGPQASLVRNLMVCPWAHELRQCDMWSVFAMSEKLGNVDALEKVFIPGVEPHGNLEYQGPSTEIFTPSDSISRCAGFYYHWKHETVNPRLLRRLLRRLKRDEDPIEFWIMADRDTMNSEDGETTMAELQP
ncbi:hypothetical protein F5Y01DRAFT_324745 [Xylaria sp. FL0043]|nr:hypothetical protein F5Y01DRAFT_324745 [Xylaria sp. FL0043]